MACDELKSWQDCQQQISPVEDKLRKLCDKREDGNHVIQAVSNTAEAAKCRKTRWHKTTTHQRLWQGDMVCKRQENATLPAAVALLHTWPLL